MEDFKAKVLALLPQQQQRHQAPCHTDVALVSSPFFAEGSKHFTGCASWQDIEDRLKGASSPKLKEMLERKGSSDAPWSNPAVIKAVLRILKSEFPSAQ